MHFFTATEDFEVIKAIEGISILINHSYNLQKRLSYLQLNELKKA